VLVAYRYSETRRRGSIAPLTCILLPVFLALAAFAVDISYIATSQSELQNASDAATLAGVDELGTYYVLYNLPGQGVSTKSVTYNTAVAAAKAKAKAYAGYNNAGGVSGLALLDADIDVGFTTASGAYTSSTTSTTNFPNTVKVNTRRDGTANGTLKLFFAGLVGTPTIDLTAPATAVAYGGTLNSLNVGTVNSRVLPVTYDEQAWDNFLSSGKDPDGNTTIDSATGYPVIQVYPSIKATGNFGMLSLDDSHNGASEIRNWIDNGLQPTDIQALKNANQIPLSTRASQWNWSGNPGLKASDIMAINNHVGETYILPLFKAYDSSSSNYQAGVGQGANFDYNIVRFVGVKVMPTSSTNKSVIVMPFAISDPNQLLTLSTVVPLGTGSFTTIMAPSKLTQ
jgi:Flp pilus assembly protein TadG